MPGKKIKVAYIISSLPNKAYPFEWLAEKINRDEFDVFFILLNKDTSSLEEFLVRNNIPVYRVKWMDKTNILSAFFKVARILRREKPRIVHTHLFEASLVGLLAARFTRIPYRFYTRHHSDSNHTYAPSAVKYDRLINSLATHIVAVSENVRKVLRNRESVAPGKITVIHHGLDFREAEQVNEDRVKKLKAKYATGQHYLVIGVIARYIHLKGVHTIIDAFAEVLGKLPGAYLLLVNTKGNYSDVIREKLRKLPAGSFLEIEFEEDLFALYRIFNVYVHTPVDASCEAFGQTYIEALATHTPAVFTLSGIANECIVPGEHALVVNYESSHEIASSIVKLAENHELCKQLADSGYAMVKERFGIDQKIQQLENLYKDVIGKTGK